MYLYFKIAAFKNLMPTAVFEKYIQELNFSFISDRGTSGVLLTANYENLTETIVSPNILFALETACKFEADAVYFRYFQDGRAAVPQYKVECSPIPSPRLLFQNSPKSHKYSDVHGSFCNY